MCSSVDTAPQSVGSGGRVLGPGSRCHHSSLGPATKHSCGLCQLRLFFLVSSLQMQSKGRMRQSPPSLPARCRHSVVPSPARMLCSGIFLSSPPQCFESVSCTGLLQSHGLTSSLLDPGKTIFPQMEKPVYFKIFFKGELIDSVIFLKVTSWRNSETGGAPR